MLRASKIFSYFVKVARQNIYNMIIGNMVILCGRKDRQLYQKGKEIEVDFSDGCQQKLRGRQVSPVLY